MLKSYEAIYDHGKIQWLSGPPPNQRFKIVVVVEQPESAVVEPAPRKRRVPPPELKGSVQWLGDPFEPAISEEEWEASEDNTMRADVRRSIQPTRIEDGYGMLVCQQPGERRLSDFDVAQAMREADSR